MKEKELEVIKFLHPNLFDNDYPGLDLEAFDDLKKIEVVIMAGGKGTRLLPLTKIIPKPLVPINNKPMLLIKDENLNKVNLLLKDAKIYVSKSKKLLKEVNLLEKNVTLANKEALVNIFVFLMFCKNFRSFFFYPINIFVFYYTSFIFICFNFY